MSFFCSKSSYRFLLMGLAVLLELAACAPPTKAPPKRPTPAKPAYAEALEAQENYLAAATEYMRLAALAQSPQQQHYQLRAVAALLQGNHLQEAQKLLNNMVPDSLDTELRLHYQLLAAQLALARQNPQQALSILENIERQKLNVEQQITTYRIRAEAYELKDNFLAAIQERIQLELLLADTEALQENQRALWQAFMSLPSDTVESLRGEPLPAIFRGWLDLAQLFQRHLLNPPALQQAIQNWQKRYPGHPASLSLIQPLLSSPPYQPATIALLLPTKGPFAAAATAIREGFFAAYYTDNSDWTPKILFYAVETSLETGTSNVQDVYQQAQADGADFIVGPLTKQALMELAQLEDLPLPTLALNHLEKSQKPVEKLYQFTLSPEDEAKTVAERAWRDGHSNALVLAPTGEWGQRVRRAFTEHWKQLGGELLEFQIYDPEEEDFSFLLQRLLNLDESEARYRTLQERLGRRLSFEPRRRQDVNFIFLAAFPPQARLLIPQLRFYRAGDLALYSSSHVYNGYPDPENDQDLDGLLFSDMPWILNQEKQKDPSYQSLATAHPASFEHLKRLYALGTDAYRIIPHLNALQQVQNMHFDGATGRLRMDATRCVQRELTWARFEAGLPQQAVRQSSARDGRQE
jgi:uncharacterized protein